MKRLFQYQADQDLIWDCQNDLQDLIVLFGLLSIIEVCKQMETLSCQVKALLDQQKVS
ncbi:hypothetical protein P691DRAFT_768795 [Macrolepiota fuliginosa MF-IS2]|uniref:Uncharacterized protein n=1 Tax=Macrolepiota fuliginosa MF-IS2 TaxID=1400762 RepID=A0A9P6BUF0_9AGAR|nr:hypothetical protein P691DRAFT_768795 [Macrolepiota fuliginosa MF-IS2]